MGCCVSTPKNNPLENNNKNNINPHQFQCVSKSPPRAEEEAVKEVLSETPKPRPKPKPKPRSRPESPRKRQVDVQVDEVREDDDDVDEEDESMMKPKVMVVTPKKEYLEQKTGNPYPDPCTPEEISEVSEICSYSETISTSTLKEEDDLLSNHHHHQHHHQVYSSKDNAADTRQQRVFRSQGYNGNFQHLHYHHPQQQHQQQQQHYRTQGKSPARRRPDPESSPARKRPPPGQTGPRREGGGDNPGRRSQSPAMRGNVGRSPSGRKTGPSPGRVRMVNGPESGRKVDEDDEAAAEEKEERRESEEWQGPNESLENPLVSLECFIFL